jgi:hypothetical protein
LLESGLDDKHPLTLNRQQSQNASGVGSGVDINSVWSNLGFNDGSMTVNNEFAKVFLARGGGCVQSANRSFAATKVPDQYNPPETRAALALARAR